MLGVHEQVVHFSALRPGQVRAGTEYRDQSRVWILRIRLCHCVDVLSNVVRTHHTSNSQKKIPTYGAGTSIEKNTNSEVTFSIIELSELNLILLRTEGQSNG